MTVCVAAIYNMGWGLVACSDRMLSASSQFESPEAKVYRFTTSIVGMFSGEDISFQRLVHDRIKARIDAKIKENPLRWLTVEEVAYLYQDCYNEARRHAAEQAVLVPFGLTVDEFVKVGASMNPRLAEQLAAELRAYRVPVIAALIIGMDQIGNSPVSNAHIYKFENWNGRDGTISCEDAVGFAAIGSGGVHAESQLMRAAYGPSRDEPTAILLTYLAKKRGEAAPGVGAQTDSIIWSHRPEAPGFAAPIIDEATAKLDGAWRGIDRSEKQALAKGLLAVTSYVRTKATPPAPTGQTATARGEATGKANAAATPESGAPGE